MSRKSTHAPPFQHESISRSSSSSEEEPPVERSRRRRSSVPRSAPIETSRQDPTTAFLSFLAQQENARTLKEIADQKERRKKKERKLEKFRIEAEATRSRELKELELKETVRLRELELKEKKKARKLKKQQQALLVEQQIEKKYALRDEQIEHKRSLLEQEDANRSHAARGRTLYRGSPPRQPREAEQETIAMYDITNPEETFPLNVRELARHKYPEMFAKYGDKDKSRWTWSTKDKTPVYIQVNASARRTYDQRVVRTPIVKQLYASISAIEYQTGTPKDKTYVHDTSIATVQEEIKRLLEPYKDDHSPTPSRSLEPDVVVVHSEHTARATRLAIIEGIQLADSIGSVISIVLDPDFPLSQHAVSKEAYERFYPEGPLDVITNRRTYFDGILTTWDASLDINVPTIEMHIQIVLAYCSSELAPYTDRGKDETPPEIITIYSFFNAVLGEGHNRKLAERVLQTWKGLSSDKPTLSRLYEDMSTILDDLGYDIPMSAEAYTLNLNKFRISVLNLIRTGSGRRKRTCTYEEALHGGKFLVGTKDLGWADVYGVQPVGADDVNCFAQALNYFLKSIGWRGNAQRFTTLYQEVGHIDFVKDRAVSPNTACIVANSLGLHCEIYRINGVLLTSSHTTTLPKHPLPKGSDRTFRLLLDQCHYVNILELKEDISPVATLKSKVKMPYSMPKLLTYYDVETIVAKNGDILPYSNAYCANLTIQESVSPDDVRTSTTHKPSLEVFRDMYEAVVSAGPGYSHHLIAYNGSKFDHLLLYTYLLKLGVSVIEGANPKGKGQSFRVAIHCPMPKVSKPALVREHVKMWLETNPSASKKKIEKIEERITQTINEQKSYLTVWDPCMFIRNTLKNAAISFKTASLKTGFDHELVQREYATSVSSGGDSFKGWIENNRDAIAEYNVNDVVVLAQLVQKTFGALEGATSMPAEQVLTKPSISNLAWSFWKNSSPEIKTTTSGKPVKQSSLYRPVKEEAHDKLIRESLVAGRTECVPGHHKGQFIMVDVVSLYPTMMKDRLFPAGKAEIVLMKDCEKLQEYFIKGVPGLYYVQWDQSTLKNKYGGAAFHPILPFRGGDTLDWKSFGKGEGLLPDVTIRQLIQYGAEVTWATPPETLVEHTKVLRMDETEEEVEVLLAELRSDTANEGVKYVVRQAGKKEWKKEVREIIWTVKEHVCAIVWPETFNLLPSSGGVLEDSPEAAPEPFKWYVEQLSDMKNQQDVWKDSDSEQYNASLREMIKMLLNALSGKVIQKNYTGQYKLINTGDEIHDIMESLLGHTVNDKEDVRKLEEEYSFGIEHLTTSVDGKPYGNVMWEKSTYSNNSKPSQLGVFIYAYARAYMYEKVFSRCEVLYSDTDSALISVDDYAKIDDDLKFARIGGGVVSGPVLETIRTKEFGMFEIEAGKGGAWLYDEAIAVAPKTYALLKNGKVVKYRCKGVRNSDVFISPALAGPTAAARGTGVEGSIEGGGVEKVIDDNQKEFFELLNSNADKGVKTEVRTWNFSGKWSKDLGLRKNTVIKWI